MLSKRRISKLLFAVAFIGIHFLGSYSAFAMNKFGGGPPYARIPLLYLTDRALSDEGFLNQRKHEKDSIYEVYCGSLGSMEYQNI